MHANASMPPVSEASRARVRVNKALTIACALCAQEPCCSACLPPALYLPASACAACDPAFDGLADATAGSLWLLPGGGREFARACEFKLLPSCKGLATATATTLVQEEGAYAFGTAMGVPLLVCAPNSHTFCCVFNSLHNLRVHSHAL